ncbi:hypothetical protein ACSBR2_015857 [Camellia fascicularis]
MNRRQIQDYGVLAEIPQNKFEIQTQLRSGGAWCICPRQSWSEQFSDPARCQARATKLSIT